MREITNTNLSKSGTRRNVKSGLLLAIAMMTTCIAFAQDEIGLKFKGAIAVVPVAGVAANGAVTLNIVRGVAPGGPWRIAALEAEVISEGRIKVEGRGLLLASGNGIGSNAAQTVHATLFCGPAATETSESTISCHQLRRAFAKPRYCSFAMPEVSGSLPAFLRAKKSVARIYC